MACFLSFFALLTVFAHAVRADPYNTFDGPGFPACNEVAAVYHPTTMDEMAALVRNASDAGVPVRASGKGHMWYDTMCTDDPNTVIIVTEALAGISNFTPPDDSGVGSLVIEAGVTFFELADYLHEHNTSIGYSLVNWNITVAGALAMGAHRSSLSQPADVAGAAAAIDLLLANGTFVHLSEAEHKDTDDWRAATTSLGLLGIIARVTVKIYPEFKLAANQKILAEKDVLEGDIYGMINPYPTANFWWWPGVKKFHYRTYEIVPNDADGEGFQSTFSLSEFEGNTAKTLLENGANSSFINLSTESLFFSIWSAPNFHDKNSDIPALFWPVNGWSYDSLIGGLYPDTKPEWDYNLRGKTLELAFPVTQANAMLTRIRELFDASEADGHLMTSTYRSGINIKFGQVFDDLLSQTSTLPQDTDADWSKGTIMFDFPTYLPDSGERYNEPFYATLAETLIDEFPCRPHWTKNTREVFQRSVKNLDPDILARFAAVREHYDPNKTFASVVGQIIGVV
ncbi:hypothetical protein BD626DRAFT_495895 [Schizophyllum amplum]|uniref:D-arabinono-1,4-lactone oxidase n=1 Tax=Schizophyllum amplum TaxID=97359 RepID=A0A550CEI2_9AGAR|nr:hypothetical protein BD626DRAFT_495895 [Auriculariopsis ampla]